MGKGTGKGKSKGADGYDAHSTYLTHLTYSTCTRLTTVRLPDGRTAGVGRASMILTPQHEAPLSSRSRRSNGRTEPLSPKGDRGHVWP